MISVKLAIVRSSFSCLLILALGVACASGPQMPSPTLAPAEILVSGATSMYPLANALIAAYREDHPQIRIRLEEERLRDGLAAVRSGQVDIGLLARDFPAGEDDAEAGQEVSVIPIGLDGIAISVNARNPVTRLSLDQLRRLYSGEVFNWAAVGGRDEEIQVVSRQEGSETRRVFETKVMHGERVTLQAVVVPSSEAMREYIAKHQAAVGYLSASYLQSGIKAVSLQGVPPDRASVRSGAYPLVRPLFLVMRPDAPEAVRAFVGFVLSQTGQAIVSRYHARIR